MISENTINSEEVETVVVCSGGGAIGLWQWVVLLTLSQHFKISMICGCSAGTLNGFAFAKGLLSEVTNLYKEVFHSNAKQITKPGIASIKDGKLKVNWIKLVPKLLFNMNGIKSLMDNNPLYDTLGKLEDSRPGNGEIPFWWNRVNMKTGKAEVCELKDFPSKPERIEALVSSTNIPIVWPLVQGTWADGGLRDGAPLGIMFDKIDPKKRYQIIVISCNNVEMAATEDLDNVLKVLVRVGLIFLNENLQNDLARIKDRNEEAKKYGEEASGRTYAPISVIEYNGSYGNFSFTPEAYLDMIQSGTQDGNDFILKSKTL